MARKQNGGLFNKMLEFIGLVDEEDPRESFDPLEDRAYTRSGYTRGSDYEPRASRTSTASRASRNSDFRSSESSRRRSSSAYEREDDLDMRSHRNSSRDDFSARPNPAMNRTSAADSRYARASRFTEDAAPERRENASMPSVREKQSAARPRMVILSLQRLEDCCDVIDHLIAGDMVLMTLDDLDVKMYQRVVDTLSGAVYALKAKIRKPSEKTYLVAPGVVDIDDAEYVARSF